MGCSGKNNSRTSITATGGCELPYRALQLPHLALPFEFDLPLAGFERCLPAFQEPIPPQKELGLAASMSADQLDGIPAAQQVQDNGGLAGGGPADPYQGRRWHSAPPC